MGEIPISDEIVALSVDSTVAEHHRTTNQGTIFSVAKAVANATQQLLRESNLPLWLTRRLNQLHQA
jgi:hypothetical protein